jgi:hypothetical protein
MSWSWWRGSRIVRVLRRPFRKRPSASKSNKPKWKKKWNLNSKNNLNNREWLRKRTHNKIFRELRGIYILKIRRWRRRRWANVICLTFIKERKQNLTKTLRSIIETSQFRRRQMNNMNRGDLLNQRKLKFLRIKLWSLKNHFNKSFTISKKKKNYWSSNTNKSSKTKRMTLSGVKKIWERKIVSLSKLELLPKSCWTSEVK